ncbi:FprA family A-type flavoprotein [Fonticella tunisiensis]|uniref:Flavorubredoxin n=1 Tax=Fonticella tunisiensis TaxID=1096341 RepID=A0A4R7KCG1_9CLOT|nr:FprA family A-type flavoprotein [Fonticella tunisiensis]TDT50953.1 flavorubredoxin [Fonticella tunisiensis]
MSSVEIKKDVYWVGVRDPELRVFDIIMRTDKGTTYNSYLIVDEKVVLIDTVKEGFSKEFISNIKSVIGDRKIDYIVVNHTEPDHSGAMKVILEEYGDAVIYGSRSALNNIKEITNRDFKGVEVKHNDELNIGRRTLKFVSAPLLHWPDTIFTYVEHDKVLFSGDVFGCHYCDDDPSKIFNDEVGDFSHELRYYYDVIMGPFKKKVLEAIEKIKQLDIDVICTTHGPILREKPWKYVDLYEEWSRVVLETGKERRALVVYVSSYGYTREVAHEIAEGIKETGAEALVYDITEHKISDLVDKLEKSKALAIGSPTINQDAVKPAWDFLSEVSPIVNRGKLAVAFGSYGWSGESVQLLTDRLKGLKFKVIEPGLKINFRPSDEEMKKARELGRQIGNQI